MYAEKENRLLIEKEKIEDNILLIKIKGDLDMYTLPQAKSTLNDAISKGFIRIILDLQDMEYIDSSGLGFFIGTLKKLKEKGGNLKLINLNNYITGIFKLINLNYIIEICNGKDEALGKLKSSA